MPFLKMATTTTTVVAWLPLENLYNLDSFKVFKSKLSKPCPSVPIISSQRGCHIFIFYFAKQRALSKNLWLMMEMQILFWKKCTPILIVSGVTNRRRINRYIFFLMRTNWVPWCCFDKWNQNLNNWNKFSHFRAICCGSVGRVVSSVPKDRGLNRISYLLLLSVSSHFFLCLAWLNYSITLSSMNKRST